VLSARRLEVGWFWPAGCLLAVVLFSSGDIEHSVGSIVPGSKAILPLAIAGFAAWLVYLGIRGVLPGQAEEWNPAVVGPFVENVDMAADLAVENAADSPSVAFRPKEPVSPSLS
ncbi:MAG TPA: hypothetical protein VGL71_12085, partial [Urbifossiella sp.]|jgi:hypothetical protein